MVPRNRRPALGLVLALLASATSADPRWWWDDVRVTATGTESVTPHVVTPGYATGGAGFGTIFLTWAEMDPAQGDYEIWVTASFDAGCTFCEATRLTDDATDDLRPRIAVLALPTGTWSFAVAFEKPATGEAVIAWDSAAVSFQVPQDQRCGELAQLGPAVIANDQYFRNGAVDAWSSSPDVSAAGTATFGHFHAAWHEVTLAGDFIRYAHDLTARGGVGWTLDPVKAVATLSPVVTALGPPRIAADLASDPDPLSGNDTFDRSAASIVFPQWRAVGPTILGEMAGLRSVDSGATFSPSGARADAPAAPLSDGTPGSTPGIGLRQPAIDAAFSSFTTTDPAWIAAAWSPPDSAGHAIACDARFMELPATPNPDWTVPGDVSVTSLALDTAGSPSLALRHRFSGLSPQWLAWHDGVPGDVMVRAGLLDATLAPPTDISRFPIPAARPLDPVVSQTTPLTACVFDEATFACVPARAAGEARDVALDANELAVFAVWADTRDGNSEIYFKRTDEQVGVVRPRLAAGCDPEAYVDVTFTVIPPCQVAGAGTERMRRYLIYWRESAATSQDPAGPIVVPASDPAPVPTRRISGLLSGTTYHVIVVPEDEARNVNPPAFDPSGTFPAQEVTVTTPADCGPPPTCLWRSDLASVRPHVPDRGAVYLVPPSADDVHLQGAAYQCPIASGDLEPDANALDNGVPLSLYQVNVAPGAGVLMLSRQGRTIRFTF